MINLGAILCEECGLWLDGLFEANTHAKTAGHTLRDESKVVAIPCECGAILPGQIYADRHFEALGHKLSDGSPATSK